MKEKYIIRFTGFGFKKWHGMAAGYYGAWLAALLCLSGCQKPSDPDENASRQVSLTLSKEGVAANAGVVWVTVDTETGAPWEISLEYAGDDTEWATVKPETGMGSTNLVQINYVANVTYDYRMVDVKMQSHGATCIKKLVQEAATAPASSGPPEDAVNPTPPQASLTGWVELPSTDLSRTAIANPANTGFIAHSAIISGAYRRNYSMLYDKKEKISYWVAYPHCSAYFSKEVARTNAWEYDPYIPALKQAYLYSSIPGYDRGHQIASADRTSDLTANKQTFYFTNMTPQNASLNQRAWERLEEWVRNNAASQYCDTLYVVTGAILRTVGGNEAVNYATDRSGAPVAVPNYYFKVLVKRSGNNYTAGIGFWFKNEEAEYPSTGASVYAKYAASIRNIEEKTGFDFFANLPQSTQDAFEGSYSMNSWVGIVP